MIKTKDSVPARIFRFIVSIVVLSALIVGIALVVKGIHNFDDTKFAKISANLLSMAHINVTEDQVGDVAGKFVERVTNTNISASSTSRLESDSNDATSTDAKLLVEVAVIADVQEDFAAFTRSLNQIKDRNISKVIVLGDLTNFGEIDALREIKKILDASGLTYYVLPGDHDLAASLNSENFIQVFGKTNYVIDIEDFNFLFLDNSANFTPLLPDTLKWFNDEVKTADFVFLAQPLFTDSLNLPFSKMYMGSTLSEPSEALIENQSRVKEQRNQLLKSIQGSAVSAVFGADHHRSNHVKDPIRVSLEHHTLGAIAGEVNDLPQKILQSSRFAILNIYDDKSYKVEEVLMD